MSDLRSSAPENQPPRRQNNRTIFYIILILLLLGINIYLYMKYYQKSTQSKALNEQVNSDSVRIADLDMKYQEALVSIESYKGQNAKLDSIIAVKEKELMGFKSNIDQLKKKMKISESDYKKQVDDLQSMVNDLATQIKDLQEKNQILITKNDSLGKTLATQLSTNEQLTSTNQVLTQKVSVASLLKPTSFKINGVRGKSSGKEVETENIKKVEKLKICFDLPENQVADAGQKTLYIRIIAPEGTTLAMQSSGSGTFQLNDTGEERQYTTAANIDYQQQAKTVCTYWQQTGPYSKGTYTGELYQDGYLTGTTKFELK